MYLRLVIVVDELLVPASGSLDHFLFWGSSASLFSFDLSDVISSSSSSFLAFCFSLSKTMCTIVCKSRSVSSDDDDDVYGSYSS